MFKEISTIIGDHIPDWIVYLLGVIVLLLYSFIYIIDKLGLKVSKEVYRILFRKKGKLNKWKLRHHEFFEYIIFLLDYKIKNLSFNNSVRERIMKDFIKSYIGSLYDYHINLLEENIKKMDKDELKRVLKITLFNAIEEHENNFILNCQERDVAKIIVRKFNKSHSKIIEAQAEAIDQIFENKYFQRNNYELVYNILNIHHASMMTLIINSTNVFYNLNGELNGKTYNGDIIEKINYRNGINRN